MRINTIIVFSFIIITANNSVSQNSKFETECKNSSFNIIKLIKDGKFDNVKVYFDFKNQDSLNLAKKFSDIKELLDKYGLPEKKNLKIKNDEEGIFTEYFLTLNYYFPKEKNPQKYWPSIIFIFRYDNMSKKSELVSFWRHIPMSEKEEVEFLKLLK
jgi:hypothetical protein